MKTVAILLCTLYLASYAVVRGDDEMPPSCLQKMGLSIGDIPKLIHDNSDEGLRKRGCIEACLMQNIGLMNGNTIDMQKISEQIDKVMKESDNKENVRKAVEECVAAAANDDECLVANSFARCGLEHLKLSIQQMIQST
ncbi:hypothetical protein ANTPLA_LOCUS5016 [Anthophora plagiata]